MPYLIDANKPLTHNDLTNVLAQFLTSDLPKLVEAHNYYDGNQKIMGKKPSDTGKPCNKVVVNYCYNIVHNYLGYLAGKKISYSSNADLDDIFDILNYNDVLQEDSEYLRQALIYGVAYEINYIDEEGKQRFRLLDSRLCVPIYDNTLDNNLLYVVRFWREDPIDESVEKYIVEVYSNTDVKRYRSVPGFSSFDLIDEYPHYFNLVPITVFKLNEDLKPIFNQITTLQDAYNTLISSEVDDWESFCDAYLVLKGVQADAKLLDLMKEKRVLMMDPNCSADYLTKNVSDTQIQNMLSNIKQLIHMISNSPDFTDEKFMAQSGVAIKYKLVGFENAASGIEAQMKKALLKRIELICSILKLTNDEMIWRDIDITFNRNLPADIASLASTISQLKGLVSDKTLLSLLPFVTDVNSEIEQLKLEKAENMELFRFGNEASIIEEDSTYEKMR